MTNTKKLRMIIGDSGLKYKAIAEMLGITPYGLQKKVDNVNEFKASEISKLCDILNIKETKLKEQIFFANKGD